MPDPGWVPMPYVVERLPVSNERGMVHLRCYWRMNLPRKLPSTFPSGLIIRRDHGNPVGSERRLVACSNANASWMSFGSLHAGPVKLTPYGAGFGTNPAGNAFVPVPGGTGSNAYGTVIVG